MGNSKTRARGEHVRRVANGRECNKVEESGDIMIRSPEGRSSVKRGDGREEALFQAVASLAVEDGVLRGFRRNAAPGAGGGSVSIVPGRMCCQVALARPHLMEAASKEFGEAHEGMRRKRGEVFVIWRRMGERSPM